MCDFTGFVLLFPRPDLAFLLEFVCDRRFTGLSPAARDLLLDLFLREEYIHPPSPRCSACLLVNSTLFAEDFWLYVTILQVFNDGRFPASDPPSPRQPNS